MGGGVKSTSPDPHHVLPTLHTSTATGTSSGSSGQACRNSHFSTWYFGFNYTTVFYIMNWNCGCSSIWNCNCSSMTIWVGSCFNHKYWNCNWGHQAMGMRWGMGNGVTSCIMYMRNHHVAKSTKNGRKTMARAIGMETNMCLFDYWHVLAFVMIVSSYGCEMKNGEWRLPGHSPPESTHFAFPGWVWTRDR